VTSAFSPWFGHMALSAGIGNIALIGWYSLVSL